MRTHALVLLATLAVVSQAQGQQAGTVELGLFPQGELLRQLAEARAGPCRARVAASAFSSVNTSPSRAKARGYRPRRPTTAMSLTCPCARSWPITSPPGEHVGCHPRRRLRAHDVSPGQAQHDNGATGSVGIRLGLGDVTSIRIDAYADYIPSPKNGASDNWNWGLQPGLSFMLGGREGKVRDKDGDGVPDKVDACPKTPAGDKVDAKGCTIKDSDGDGVLDDVDACADTPPATRSTPRAARCPRMPTATASWTTRISAPIRRR